MKKIFLILAACAGVALPQVAQAQAPYVSGFGAVNFTNDVKDHHVKLSFDPGFAVGGAVGYQFNCLRLEAEFSYRRTALDKIHVKRWGFSDSSSYSSSDSSVSLPSSSLELSILKKKYSLSGHVQLWSVLANGYYDFDLNNTCLKPYVGVGIGYAHTKASLHKIHGMRFHTCETDDNFAWQVMAGVAYPITPCVDLTMEYRFFSVVSKPNLHNHNVGAGLRYWF